MAIYDDDNDYTNGPVNITSDVLGDLGASKGDITILTKNQLSSQSIINESSIINDKFADKESLDAFSKKRGSNAKAVSIIKLQSVFNAPKQTSQKLSSRNKS